MFPKAGPSEVWKLQGSTASVSMLWVSDQEHRLGSSVQNNPTAAGNAKAIHLEFIIKYLHISTSIDPVGLCTTIELYKQTAQMLMEGFMTARAILDRTGNICADHTVCEMCKALCGLYWENSRQKRQYMAWQTTGKRNETDQDRKSQTGWKEAGL